MRGLKITLALWCALSSCLAQVVEEASMPEPQMNPEGMEPQPESDMGPPPEAPMRPETGRMGPPPVGHMGPPEGRVEPPAFGDIRPTTGGHMGPPPPPGGHMGPQPPPEGHMGPPPPPEGHMGPPPPPEGHMGPPPPPEGHMGPPPPPEGHMGPPPPPEGRMGPPIEGPLRPETPEADGVEGDSESEEEMLVRCKRPMCRMFCAYGFRTGEDGCPVCQCQANPCETVECPSSLFCRPKRCHGGPCAKPEAECVELPLDCPLLKCVRMCDHGYFKDQHGCRTCECLPAEEPIGLSLPPEVAASLLPCPMPMCAEPCPFGFKDDERGCMTCQCHASKQEMISTVACQHQECGDGLVCYMKSPLNCDGVCSPLPTCTVPSLCHSMRESLHHIIQEEDAMQFPPEMKTPVCEEDGTFSPTQCSDVTKQCWCVDDRGRPVEGSPSMSILDPSPCQANHTSVLRVNFVLTHDLEDEDITITLQSGRLHAVIKEHMSRWVGMKTENIVIVAVIPAEGRLLIQVVLMQDGVTDLPSAANHLGNEMRRGHCRIPYNDRSMTPDPESVQVHHQYLSAHGVRDVEEGIRGFCRRHKTAMIVGSVGATLFFVLMLALALYVCLKKRLTQSQFAHKKLKNMNMFKENLRISTDWDHPDLIVAEKEPKNVELLSKEPIA